MKRRLFFVLVSVVFFMPFLASAVVTDPAGLLSGSPGLVAQCEGAGCLACNLVDLGNNVINFALAFSVIVATLMFAYAGILYVTAGGVGGEQVKKAHKVFINVFVGLIIVLTAWLLVNILFSVLTGKDINAWTKISCVGNPESGAFPDAPNVPTSTGVTTGSTPVVATNADDRLAGVHPDLICLVNAAHRYSTIPFVVTSGFRTSSATASDSRHLYGLAVDAHPIINGIVSYTGGSRVAPNANYQAINVAFVRARQDCNNVEFQWGGSSPTFMQGRYYDSMHFQLLRSQYPDSHP